MKQEGSDRFRALCPFHEEKTPSFVYYEDTDKFYCFGCTESGDGITFLIKKCDLDFETAKQQWIDFIGGYNPQIIESRIQEMQKETVISNLIEIKLIINLRNALQGNKIELKEFLKIWEQYDKDELAPNQLEELVKKYEVY